MGKELAAEWLKSALSDLKNIEHIIKDDFLTQVVSFHSQQCVEKCFKAVLEFNSKKIPRDHSTLKLYETVKKDVREGLDLNILTDLDDLYINSRYPGDLGLLPDGKPTLKDAEAFYSFAKCLYDDIIRKLELSDFSGKT